MSQENVEIVRRFYDAVNMGNVDPVMALVDPEAELRAVGRLPDIGKVRGHEAVREWAASLLEAFDIHFELERITDTGDAVVVAVKGTMRGRRSGVVTTNRLAHVWHIQNGLVIGLDAYRDETKALETVGLLE